MPYLEKIYKIAAGCRILDPSLAYLKVKTFSSTAIILNGNKTRHSSASYDIFVQFEFMSNFFLKQLVVFA